MQVSVAGLRRNIKNIAHNYTDPQKKVREATSNDPWGPSSTLMSEIADLTYNIEAFSQIMEMLWKRLNDHGKNWRHVYKSLVLLEYLIKTGTERVAQQCKENIFAIQTLKDFQYFEESKDQGLNVREKAKHLVTLLTSEERLRNERARALKARERFAQTVSAFGSSDSNDTTPTSPVFASHQFAQGGELVNGHGRVRKTSEIEQARPQTIGEEELQLQLALAMSKEEADQEEKRRRSDDLRLQLAISQSQSSTDLSKDCGNIAAGGAHSSSSSNGIKLPGPSGGSSGPKKENSSALVDLLDVDIGGGSSMMASGGATALDPWGKDTPVASSSAGAAAGILRDPWSGSNSGLTSPQDPWATSGASQTSAVVAPVAADPWAPVSASSSPAFQADPWSSSSGNMGLVGGAIGGLGKDPEEDEFDALSKRGTQSESKPYNMDALGMALLAPTNTGGSNNSQSSSSSPNTTGGSKGKKNPLEFLGENSGLVNLDNLVPSSNPTTSTGLGTMGSNNGVQNPFGSVVSSSLLSNPMTMSGSSSTTAPPPAPANPFQIHNVVAKPSINEIREKQKMNIQGLSGGSNNVFAATPPQNNPWSPVKQDNPFSN